MKKILCIVLAITVMFTMSTAGTFAVTGEPEQSTEATQQQVTGGQENGPEPVVSDANGAEIPEVQGSTVVQAKPGNACVYLSWDTIYVGEGEARTKVEAEKFTIDIATVPEDPDVPPVTATDVPVIGDDLTTVTIDELVNDQEYSFTISYKLVEEGPIIPVGEVNETPKDLQIDLETLSGYKSVTLRWKPVSDYPYSSDIEYVIERATSLDGEYTVLNEGTIITAEGLDEGEYITYRDGGESYGWKAPYYNQPENSFGTPKYYYRVYVKNAREATISDTISDACVRQLQIKVTLKMYKKLTSHDGKRKTLRLKKGTRLYTDGFGSGKYHFHNKSGNLFYVMRVATKNATPVYWKGKSAKNYSHEEAELYVNERGVSSEKSRLIWVSEFCQRLYVFNGSKYNWKCVASWDISTGKANTPSPTGSKKIHRKQYYRGSGHWIHYWNYYSSMNALHGLRYSSWKNSLGSLASGGCIRNTNTHAKHIYTRVKDYEQRYCPKYTRVLVY